jgi:DNA invertase Pin-like site-specific DNA recombinase
MPRGRPNRSGIDWSDPASAAEHKKKSKRKNERHHEYNREYNRAYTDTPTAHMVGHSALNSEIAREIRAKYAAGGITYRELAIEYGVSYATINNVINRRVYKEEN